MHSSFKLKGWTDPRLALLMLLRALTLALLMFTLILRISVDICDKRRWKDDIDVEFSNCCSTIVTVGASIQLSKHRVMKLSIGAVSVDSINDNNNIDRNE